MDQKDFRGNFEPAAKYLFNKYIRSFDPEDGLSFEYNMTEEYPPLSMAKVEDALQAWLEENPGTVAQSTIKLFFYLRFGNLTKRSNK